MPNSDADKLVGQIEGQARYEALREVVNQLAGILFARERSATSPDEAQRWSDEHQAVRARLEEIDPGTAAVDEALAEWSARLRQLRGGGE